MVHYNQSKIEQDVIEFCRFPVPRTPSDIVRYLKMKNKDFYAKTPSSQVVKFVRRDVLSKLEEKNLIIRYSKEDEDWSKARKLLSYYFSRQFQASPRKLTEMYQINFLYLGEDALMFNLPSFKEINLDATTLLHNLTNNKEYEGFFLNFLNLIYCYSNSSMRDRLRIEIYRLSFNDRERDVIERILEITSNSNGMQKFYSNFPFQPDLTKALKFLTML